MKTAITIEITQAVRLYLRTYQFASLLGVWITLLVCGGCAAPARNPAKDKPRQVGATDVNQPIRSADFLRFLLSREGQQIVAAGGNIPLEAATVEQGRRTLAE
jgi:stage V sporulation protein SpoVS